MVALLTVIVLTVLPLCIGVLRFVQNRSWRALVQGIGLSLIPVGLYLLGVMDLAVNGVYSIAAWVQRTAWTQSMTHAAILTGVGITMVTLGRYLTSGQPKSASPEPATSAVSETRPSPALPPKGTKPALDPDDAEIEALLASRGIQ